MALTPKKSFRNLRVYKGNLTSLCGMLKHTPLSLKFPSKTWQCFFLRAFGREVWGETELICQGFESAACGLGVNPKAPKPVRRLHPLLA